MSADTLPAIEQGPPALAAGEQVDRYEVLHVLGAGGMGVVYDALDTSLNRRVALKVMQPTLLGDPLATRRLFREAQAMARVRDRHVITVHDVGIDGDQVFIAMELVPGGGTLRDWWEASPRDTAVILRKLVDAGEALEAAHDQRVVHRDFKPDNVLVDDNGEVLVTDFGLATAGEDTGQPSSRSVPRAQDLLATPLTQTGAAVGTPAYMAPEQHRGERADARADQFSFCVTAYEALFGQLPFAGRTRRELVESMKDDDVREPEGRRDVPGVARTAIWKGLRYEPQARHASMAPLLAALRAAEEHLHRAPRSRVAMSVAAAAFAVVVLGAAAATQLTTSKSAVRDAASSPALTAEMADAAETAEPTASSRGPASAPWTTPTGQTPSSAPAASSGSRLPSQGHADCRGYCERWGQCAKRGEGPPSQTCVAVSDADCRRSSHCREFGRCVLAASGGRCVATAASCRASHVCTAKGRCTLRDGGCVRGAADDCSATATCRASGACSYDATQKRCAALTNADCQGAKVCAEKGRCIASGGVCVGGGSDVACRKSTFCSRWGRCHWNGTRCIAKSIADCRKLNPHKDNWAVIDGECANAP